MSCAFALEVEGPHTTLALTRSGLFLAGVTLLAVTRSLGSSATGLADLLPHGLEADTGGAGILEVAISGESVVVDLAEQSALENGG